jgi:hypothetical protein
VINDREPCGALTVVAVTACLIPCFILHYFISLQAEYAFIFWVTGISAADDGEMQRSLRGQLEAEHPELHYVSRQFESMEMGEDQGCRMRAHDGVEIISHLYQASSPIDARGSLFEEDSETE